MSEFTITVDVNAPQAAVFSYLADGTLTPQWYEAVRSARRIAEAPTGVGARYEFVRDLPQGEVVNEVEVSEYEQPRLVTFSSRSGPTPFVYRYLIEETEQGSRVTLEGAITGKGLKGPAALLAPLAGKFFEKGMAKNLRVLKGRLENEQGDTPHAS